MTATLAALLTAALEATMTAVIKSFKNSWPIAATTASMEAGTTAAGTWVEHCWIMSFL